MLDNLPRLNSLKDPVTGKFLYPKGVYFRYVPIRRSIPKIEYYALQTPEWAAANGYDDTILTLATTLSEDKQTVFFGWSMNNPMDNHNKDMARRISYGRLRAHPLEVKREENVTMTDIFVNKVMATPLEIHGPYRRVLQSIAIDYQANGDIAKSLALHGDK